jgi:hypothetical protein
MDTVLVLRSSERAPVMAHVTMRNPIYVHIWTKYPDCIQLTLVSAIFRASFAPLEPRSYVLLLCLVSSSLSILASEDTQRTDPMFILLSGRCYSH